MIKIVKEKKNSLIGKTIGRYVVEEFKKKGSYGAVFKARHVKKLEFVAVKTLDPNLAQEPYILEAIGRETEAVKKLRGADHIVEVMDWGTIEDTGTVYDGQPYIMMEYMDLGSVQDNYTGLGLEGRVARIIDGIKGLQVAHSQGVLHRDFRLDNLLMDSERGTKLSDFSIAKILLDAGIGSTRGKTMRQVFQKAPEEQPEMGGISTKESDVWHVGATLMYAAIKIEALQGTTEYLMSGYPDIHPDLKQVIADCLLGDPKKRPSLAEVRKRLEKIPPDFMNPVLYGMIQDSRKALMGIGNRYKGHKFKTLSHEDIEELYATLGSSYDAMRAKGFKTPIGELEITVIGIRDRDDDTILDWAIEYSPEGKKRKKITKEVTAIGTVYRQVLATWIEHTNKVLKFKLDEKTGAVSEKEYKHPDEVRKT